MPPQYPPNTNLIIHGYLFLPLSDPPTILLTLFRTFATPQLQTCKMENEQKLNCFVLLHPVTFILFFSKHSDMIHMQWPHPWGGCFRIFSDHDKFSTQTWADVSRKEWYMYLFFKMYLTSN